MPSAIDFAGFLKRTSGLSDAEAAAKLKAAKRAKGDGSRIRARWSTSGPVIVRDGRGRRTMHRAGVVELVDLPGFPFDYRVALRVVEGDRPAVEVEAFVVIGRPDRPEGESVTGSTMRKAAVRAVTQRAMLALSLLADAGEGPVTVTEADLVGLKGAGETSERRERRTSAEVDAEARKVAKLYASGAPYRTIAQRMGWGGEDKKGEDRARDRARRAEALGLLGPAQGTRGRRKPV